MTAVRGTGRDKRYHDRFLPVGHWFRGRLRVDEAASHRGCRGCVATCCRGEWTQECPMRGKVPCRVRKVFSTGFGLEASKSKLCAKVLKLEQGFGRGRASFT